MSIVSQEARVAAAKKALQELDDLAYEKKLPDNFPNSKAEDVLQLRHGQLGALAKASGQFCLYANDPRLIPVKDLRSLYRGVVLGQITAKDFKEATYGVADDEMPFPPVLGEHEAGKEFWKHHVASVRALRAYVERSLTKSKTKGKRARVAVVIAQAAAHLYEALSTKR